MSKNSYIYKTILCRNKLLIELNYLGRFSNFCADLLRLSEPGRVNSSDACQFPTKTPAFSNYSVSHKEKSFQVHNFLQRRCYANFQCSRYAHTSSSNISTPVKKNDVISEKSQPNTFKRLFNLAKPERWTLAGGVGLLFISSSVTMSVPFIVGSMIDSIYGNGVVTDSVNEATLFSLKSSKEAASLSMEKLCALIGSVFLVGGAANCGRVYLMTTAGQRISQSLRSSVFSSLITQDTVYFDRHKTGELVSRLAADTPIVASSVTNNVADGIRSLMMATAAVAMMMYTSPELSLYGLAVVPPVALLAAAGGRRLRGLSTSVQADIGSCTQHAEERLSNIRTVRVFGQELKEVQKQDSLLHSALHTMYREAKMKSLFFGMTGVTGNLIILSVLYRGSTLVTDNLLTVGSLSSFLMYAAYVGLSVSGISGAYSELSKGAGAADRLFELLDSKPLIPLHTGTVLSPSGVVGNVTFRGVDFTYPTRRNYSVFNDLNLTVQAGSVVAVVGASGCGKSSLISLLLRLYDPDSGSILLDGTDIRTISPSSLRASIGVVSQEPILFSGTVRENITYGIANPKEVSDEVIQEAIEQANALSFISEFPHGLETVVGERGMLVSGGQRQRLAIARALITNPRLLCLDEATSALDSESEHLVQEAIERLMQGRTVLTIAHRLSTVRNADSIAVLAGGKVAELGTYAQLMERKDGVFRRLVNKQTLAA